MSILDIEACRMILAELQRSRRQPECREEALALAHKLSLTLVRHIEDELALGARRETL